MFYSYLRFFSRSSIRTTSPGCLPWWRSVGQMTLFLLVVFWSMGCPPPRSTVNRIENKIDDIRAGQEFTNRALEELVALARQQGTGEITVFFPSRSARIARGSQQYERLVHFLDFLSRESRGRTLYFALVGSASAPGSPESNQLLSEERARALIPIIDTYLVNIPHEYHYVAGNGATYAPQEADRRTRRRYRSVRVIAVFDPQLLVPPSPDRVEAP